MKRTEPLSCPASAMLQLVSEKHVAILLYVLKDGRLSFGELRDATHINTATLSRRLETLCGAELIIRDQCPTDTRLMYYELTPRGKKVTQLLGKIGAV